MASSTLLAVSTTTVSEGVPTSKHPRLGHVGRLFDDDKQIPSEHIDDANDLKDFKDLGKNVDSSNFDSLVLVVT